MEFFYEEQIEIPRFIAEREECLFEEDFLLMANIYHNAVLQDPITIMITKVSEFSNRYIGDILNLPVDTTIKLLAVGVKCDIYSEKGLVEQKTIVSGEQNEGQTTYNFKVISNVSKLSYN